MLRVTDTLRATFVAILSVLVISPVANAAERADKDAATAAETTLAMPSSESRPSALLPLYSGYMALQAYDVYSTLRGVKSGVSEANPVMTSVAGNPGALIGVKVGLTVGSIYAAERLWRQHHRGQAIAIMVASNSVMAIVAAHNAGTHR